MKRAIHKRQEYYDGLRHPVVHVWNAMTLGITIRVPMAPEGAAFIAKRVIIAIVLKTLRAHVKYFRTHDAAMSIFASFFHSLFSSCQKRSGEAYLFNLRHSSEQKSPLKRPTYSKFISRYPIHFLFLTILHMYYNHWPSLRCAHGSTTNLISYQSALAVSFG